MDSLVDNISFIEQITNLSSLNQIIETIMVDTNVGSINVQKVVKTGDLVKNISEDIDYKLKSTKLIIKSDSEFNKSIIISDIDSETILNNKPLCECIARNTNNIFDKEFSNLKNTVNHQIKYFKQGFFKKIFNETTNEELISKILEVGSGNSWMVAPPTLIDEFRNSNQFSENQTDCKSLIYNVGQLKDFLVYLNPNQKSNTIYFGNYDSLTLIINKNVSIEDTKTSSSTYTKAFNMEVNYLFIENKPITILEVQ